jgi:hypothetical protein
VNRKYTIPEMGRSAKRGNPNVYTSDLTDREAGRLYLKNDREAWIMVKEEAPEAGPDTQDIAGGIDFDSIQKAIVKVSKQIPMPLPAPLPFPGMMMPMPIASPFSVHDTATAASNYPADFVREAWESVVAFHPDNIEATVGGLATLAEGTLRRGARAIGTQEGSILGEAIGQKGGQMWGGEEATPDELDVTEHVAQFVYEDTKEKLLDPQEWIEHPARNSLIASGLLPIPLRAMGMPTLGQLVKAVSPTLQGYRMARRAKDIGFKVAGTVESEREGVLSGVQGPAIREAYASLKDTDPKIRAVFHEYMRNDDAALNFFSMARESLRSVREKRGLGWKENYGNLVPSRDLDFSHSDIRRNIRKFLNERGANVPEDINISLDYKSMDWEALGVLAKRDMQVIRQWIRNIENIPPNRLDESGKITLEALDTIRKTAWYVTENIKREHKGANSLMQSMYHIVGDQLKADVSGYKRLMDDFGKTSDLIDGFEAALNIKTGSPGDMGAFHKAQLKAMANVIKSLKDTPTGHMTRTFIEDMSKATGAPFMPAAAGAMLNNWVGSGIISRNQLAGLATTGIPIVAGSMALGAGPLLAGGFFLIAQAPFVSPRLVGELVLPAVAATARQKNAIMGILKSIHSKVPEGWDTDGMTFYQVAQRLNEHLREEQMKQGTLTPVHDFTGRQDSLTEGTKAPVRDFTGIR